MRGNFLASLLTTTALVFSASLGLAADQNDDDGDADAATPLQIVVSLRDQSLQVFRGTEVVATSRVSSGKPGHSTPTGIFSILAKKKFHRSNIYSNAPMPWMQRLTWSGIALHESDQVPEYPASHGCVRLPAEFAHELFQETAVGEHVVISDAPVTPEPLASAFLPQPTGPAPYDPLKDQWRVLYEVSGSLKTNPAPLVSTAALLAPVRDGIGFAREVDGAPLRVLVTRRSRQEITADIQRLLNSLGYNSGPVDGLIGPATWSAVKKFQEDKQLIANGTITPEFTRALFAAAGQKEPETGRITVLQKSHILFDAPIGIDDPDQPLGTHLITASAFDRKAHTTQWLAMTLENQIPEFTRVFLNIDAEASHDVAAADALSRLRIPDYTMKRIGALLTPGSSISISDTGTVHTGWTTYFLILTHTGRPA